jgi:exodeoxyribonuclease V gamma subunit
MAESVAIQQVLPFGNAASDLPRPAGNSVAARTGLRLHYSNRTERLLENLIANLEATKCKPGASLFDAATIIVPNRQTETYLKFGIARATGIASNFRMPFLRSFLEEVITDCRQDVRIVSGKLLQGLLLTLLSDQSLLRQDDFAPLQAYLLAAGQEADAVDLRRWQLSGRIAHLFEEYGYSRPEMLEAWASEREGARAAGTGPGHWQKRLWRELWTPKGLVARRAKAAGQTWLTGTAAFRSLSAGDLGRALPPELHMFGISYVARAFHEILATLASATDLHLYTVNPCPEFREDAPASLEAGHDRFPSRGQRLDPAHLAEDDPYGLREETETPALRLWGRPGRENVRLLNDLAGCEVVPGFDDPPERESSLLRQLQRDIFAREPERAAPAYGLDFRGDRSLTVLACPGIRREVETIAAEIWSLVEEDEKSAAGQGRPPLRFNDIAVILPAGEIATYQAHTASVFGETYEIPCNLVDLPLSSESRLVEAAGLLLKLPFGRFTRQDVLRVATHPCVIGRFPDADPEQWVAWCDRLAVFHGADHEDHCDTYIERDLCNWDQGVKRLALGAFLSGRQSGDERVYESAGERYLPEEAPAGSLESAAGFAALVRSLIEDARFCRGRTLAMSDWIRFFQALFQSYFVPQSEEDERALMHCRGAAEALEELGLGDQKVGYRIPYELVTGFLSSVSGGKGQYLADGVVVSSFLPMRAIPFRVVFVAGLGEGKFPAAEPRDPLDLRQARRHAGDVSPRERDKYMFLETLLCARERLYLSYVARDPLVGDELSPSSVIRELRQLLERGYLGKDGFMALVRTPPLRRFDESSETLARLAPAALAESQARDLGLDLRRHTKGHIPSGIALRETLDPGAWNLLASRLSLAEPPEPPAIVAPGVGAPIETVAVSLSSLRKFLECPLQGAARAYLKLRDDDEEDALSRDNEDLEARLLPKIMLMRRAFLDAVEQVAARSSSGEPPDRVLARVYDERAALGELEGDMPTGPFAVAERERNLRVLQRWWTVFQSFVPPGDLRIYRFGRAEEHAVVDEVLGPLVLEDVAAGSRRIRVEIFGQTNPVTAAPSGSVLLLNHKTDGGKPAQIRLQRDSLRVFLDQLMLAASGVRPPEEYRAYAAVADSDPEEGHSSYTEVFDPVSREEASRFLAGLCGEMLSGGNDRLLPCEAVFEFQRDPSRSVVELVDKLRHNDRPPYSYSFRHGPVTWPETYPPPEEAAARALIERRFGLYFRKQKRRGAAR